jgi:hypothetical protein
MTSKEDHIEWRRSKVMELSAQGYSEREIATKLQVSKTITHLDLVHLRKEAQESLSRHLHEVVPEEYQRCITGIKQNLRQTLEIADTVADPRVKLQARSIANECYHSIMDLCTNAGVVSEAMKFMERKREQLDTLQQHKIETETKTDERIEEEHGIY